MANFLAKIKNLAAYLQAKIARILVAKSKPDPNSHITNSQQNLEISETRDMKPPENRDMKTSPKQEDILHGEESMLKLYLS